MRTDLIVPFNDKDKVKALGAKWDGARKVWYVENIEKMEAFLPWIKESLKNPTKTPNKPNKNKKRNKNVEDKK